MATKRLTWFILARLAVITLFLVASYVLVLREPVRFERQALDTFAQLIVATYLFSLLSLLAIRRFVSFLTSLTCIQIVWDLLFTTTILLLTGGIVSPFSFLYLLSIASASLLLSRREAIYTASLCSILYGAILDLQYFGYLTPLGLNRLQNDLPGGAYYFYSVFLTILAFYLTAFLTGNLAERLRRSESALNEKAVDLEELERLNSAIVTNLSSGLLTINREGRIRVFNKYAEAVTGVPLHEAYDRPLVQVLPPFGAFADIQSSVSRGETTLRTARGDLLTVGFNTVPLLDKDGVRSELVIIFQDLTHIKRMERALQRADHLAAIGELSARIAHEIRNPLASISGSAQMLASEASVSGDEKKLLNIMVREADRLNQLITEFLGYARPTQPVKRMISLSDFIGDLLTFIRNNQKFQSIVLQQNILEGLQVQADADQLHQVLWNLVLNAAEAMPAGGHVTITADYADGSELRQPQSRVVRICVSDDGPGMDSSVQAKIFEPFYSTKNNGTGLGLATVYRIIEAHDGSISVESHLGEGTVCKILLPADEAISMGVTG